MIDSRENITEMLKRHYFDAMLYAVRDDTQEELCMGLHYVDMIFGEKLVKEEIDKMDEFIKGVEGNVNMGIDIYKNDAYKNDVLDSNRVLHVRTSMEKENIKKLVEYNIDVFLMTLHAMLRESLYVLLK